MALKFKMKIRVFPGFYLNLSKSRMSATVGMRGLCVNVGKSGTFFNTGIPATGIYDRVRLGGKVDSNNFSTDNSQTESNKIHDETIEIKSYQPELLTSDGLYGLKESIINAQKIKEELRK